MVMIEIDDYAVYYLSSYLDIQISKLKYVKKMKTEVRNMKQLDEKINMLSKINDKFVEALKNAKVTSKMENFTRGGR